MRSIEQLIEQLIQDGNKIGEDAANGNEKAKAVIRYYTMFHKFQENGSLTFLDKAYDEWAKETNRDENG